MSNNAPSPKYQYRKISAAATNGGQERLTIQQWVDQQVRLVGDVPAGEPKIPRASPSAASDGERGKLAATAVLQIVETSLCAFLHGDRGNARTPIEALLRDEFADATRTTLSEIRREDGEPPACAGIT